MTCVSELFYMHTLLNVSLKATARVDGEVPSYGLPAYGTPLTNGY